MSTLPPRPVAVLTALTLLVSACGHANTTADQPSAGRPGASPSASGTRVVVHNCGREVAVTTPLRRAVTTEQAPTEMLLTLGLADRMAGTANMKTAPLPELKAAYDKVPVLSPKILTPELTLGATPDIVVSSYDSLFGKDRAGTREELAARGVATYLWEGECPKAARTIADPIEAVYADYRNLGTLFGVSDAAEKLVKKTQDEVAAAGKHQPTGAAPRLLWVYSVFGGQPYVAGGVGIPSAIGKKLGAVNVFEDVDDHWPEVQWEQLAARNPDVIVLADLSSRGRPGDKAEEKITMLKENPATAAMPAVKEDRFIVVDGAGVDFSVRFPSVLKKVSDELTHRGLLK